LCMPMGRHTSIFGLLPNLFSPFNSKLKQQQYNGSHKLVSKYARARSVSYRPHVGTSSRVSFPFQFHVPFAIYT
jgi:hypothetical protein